MSEVRSLCLFNRVAQCTTDVFGHVLHALTGMCMFPCGLRLVLDFHAHLLHGLRT